MSLEIQAWFIKRGIGQSYENRLQFGPWSPFSDENNWNKTVDWYWTIQIAVTMSECIIFLDMATHWLSYTGQKKKDSTFLLQRLTRNVTLWLLPRFDHLFTVKEAICTRYCPCSLLANWLHCPFDPLLGRQLMVVGTFPGCGIAVPIWSALCGHTTVALETHLCHMLGHSQCANCTSPKHINALKAKVFSVFHIHHLNASDTV